mgnify:CR=1 FL=1
MIRTALPSGSFLPLALKGFPMKLYFSRNPSPRLALAVARHLNAPIEYEFAAPFAPGQAEKFRPLNPTLRIPILEENGQGLWEADAIACRLSLLTGSDFWAAGELQPDMIRWISWGKDNFVRATEMVHFEVATKLRYQMGPTDAGVVKAGIEKFHEAAPIVDAHLETHDWLANNQLSYADFRMATFLHDNDIMQLPVAQFPAISAWLDRLKELKAWTDPFEGLDAPALPPIE